MLHVLHRHFNSLVKNLSIKLNGTVKVRKSKDTLRRFALIHFVNYSCLESKDISISLPLKKYLKIINICQSYAFLNIIFQATSAMSFPMEILYFCHISGRSLCRWAQGIRDPTGPLNPLAADHTPTPPR